MSELRSWLEAFTAIWEHLRRHPLVAFISALVIVGGFVLTARTKVQELLGWVDHPWAPYAFATVVVLLLSGSFFLAAGFVRVELRQAAAEREQSQKESLRIEQELRFEQLAPLRAAARALYFQKLLADLPRLIKDRHEAWDAATVQMSKGETDENCRGSRNDGLISQLAERDRALMQVFSGCGIGTDCFTRPISDSELAGHDVPHLDYLLDSRRRRFQELHYRRALIDAQLSKLEVALGRRAEGALADFVRDTR